MEDITIRCDFAKLQIAGSKTVLQFELDPAETDKPPALSGIVDKHVFLTVADQQPSIDMGELYADDEPGPEAAYVLPEGGDAA